MQSALPRHDAIAREAVESHRGVVVKMSGDGVHAAFDDPQDALLAVLVMQEMLADPAVTSGIALRVRCGLHAGRAERRDNDFFGSVVNRAARISNAAHGGQILLSQAVAVLVAISLPAAAARTAPAPTPRTRARTMFSVTSCAGAKKAAIRDRSRRFAGTSSRSAAIRRSPTPTSAAISRAMPTAVPTDCGSTRADCCGSRPTSRRRCCARATTRTSATT